MVTLVNKLTVHGDIAEFEKVSEELTRYMEKQPGYVRYALLRSINKPEVFVEIAWWITAEAHQNAIKSAGFQDLVQRLVALASVEPDMYSPVREGSSILD
ncbi:antibiotic biosynthesis monooxygenase family protein [Sciscionella marina]|uniref:antibiotic biosynthesis monooxygenase family protein n=1 Tax=Sciscionella marina TaxID=508770 RepID=UPI000379CA1C|nr:antibiotic biosynthesis monooxygenase family protein [Sciscionella marina]